MSKKSILLVDDEEIILSSIGWVLEKNDFAVTVAKSGQEAIDNLRTRKYDLVITDLIMAKVDGVAVLKQAKKLYPDSGVIILTGHGNVNSAVETLKLGADDYLQKPCDVDELLNKARLSFEKQDLLTQLRNQNRRLQNEIAIRKSIEVQLQESQAHLEQKVGERTAELTSTVDELHDVLQVLQRREKELHEKNKELRDTNTTLNILLKRREREHDTIRKDIAIKTVEMVRPLLKKAQNQVSGSAKAYLETAQANLLDAVSEHQHDIVLINAKLTPRELQVIHYIRQDKTSKEMADLLNLSLRTIESYRDNIRKKLGIKNRKKNLKKFITSLL